MKVPNVLKITKTRYGVQDIHLLEKGDAVGTIWGEGVVEDTTTDRDRIGVRMPDGVYHAVNQCHLR